MASPRILIFGVPSDQRQELTRRLTGLVSYIDTEASIKEFLNNTIDILVTVAPTWEDFQYITKLNYDYRRRWIHFVTVEEVSNDRIIDGFLARSIKFDDPKWPLISIMTTGGTRDQLLVSYNSLTELSYDNWEWCLSQVPLMTMNDLPQDPRVTDQSAPRGQFVIFLRAGDQLYRDMLSILTEATVSSIDMFAFDEIHCAIASNEAVDVTAYEQAGRVRRPFPLSGVHLSKAQHAIPYSYAISRSLYHNLPRATEIEYLACAMTHKKFLMVACYGHIFASPVIERTALAPYLVRFYEIPVRTDNVDYWKLPAEESKVSYRVCKRGLISIVMPTFDRGTQLRIAIDSVLDQIDDNFELCIIGDVCPWLASNMESIIKLDPRIRVFNLPSGGRDSGTTPRNYALRCMTSGEYIAYLDDDNTWEPNHLSSLRKSISEGGYAFSSFFMNEYKIICREPKFRRVDTSALLHPFMFLIKYGFWSFKEWAHDWELVNRWVKAGEKYTATQLPTLRYNADPARCNALNIYQTYGDQTA